jgi:prevent-host-death family protein
MVVSENEIGLREGRAKFGDLVNRAEYAGEITYITRHGRRVAAIVPINRIAKEPIVRTVSSTIDRVDPTVTPDIRDEVRAAVEAGHIVRESYSVGDSGAKDYHIRVVEFELDGQKRWAMVHDDPNEAELIDSSDRDEIEKLYEKQVSDLANISDWGFDETDVDIAVTLYETNSDILVIARGDNAWSLLIGGDHMLGQFAADAKAWTKEQWEPNEGDGQNPTHTDDLKAVATWEPGKGVTLLVREDSLGRAARDYLGDITTGDDD